MSMTPLIDVIFLLLLFFMLSSTFSRFAEIELDAVGTGEGIVPETPPLFVQLGPETVTLNGAPLDLADPSALADAAPGTTILVSLRGPVTSQRLTDALVAFRAFPGLTVTVLGD
ncbi:biopolymer transporter ExbD [Rhodobacterales bacterium HKCCE3408]|nr:biopolymer transporter ExbD [Rhodobacterales bacterium HKCCE3408]